MTEHTAVDFDHLTVQEKIRHVTELWDRISNHPEEIEVPPEQHQELIRRQAAHQKNPNDVFTWEEVKAQILGKP